jgi:DNA-binding response OmpR family regulator/DnaJ-domain-containing protein 1
MPSTVLCVDNDRNLCQIIAKALAAAGYEVATEYDGERALATIAEEPPDLVLMDLMLPHRDGFAVLEAVRELPGPAARTPVVLLSGCSPTPEYLRRASSLDAVVLLTKPVPLEKLIEVVSGQLGEAKPPAPVERAQKTRSAQPDTQSGLSGQLERFPFPALLHHLHGLRASGVLRLQSGPKRKSIQLREGYPTAVRSNLLNECLGNFLARAGRIGSEVIEESLRHMKKRGRLQGEILVAMQVLTEEDVSRTLQDHAEQKLLEIFSWQTGRFRFEFGADLQKASGLAQRSPANLILRGVRTRTPLDRIDAVLRAKRGSHLRPAQTPFYRFQEIDLDPEQRRWLEGLDGSQRLGAYLEAEEGLRRTLYGLVATGLVELGEREVVAGGAAPRAPRRAALTPADNAKRVELTAMAERFSQKNEFEILGVSEKAGEEEVNAAYEELAELAHPDRVNAASDAVKQLAAQVFAHVERAHQTLTDPRRRQRYLLDRKRENRQAAQREQDRRALDAEQHFQRGEAALRQRDYEAALMLFGRALELYPEDGEYTPTTAGRFTSATRTIWRWRGRPSSTSGGASSWRATARSPTS